MKIDITKFQESDREQLRQLYKEVRLTNFTWLEPEFIESSSFDKDTEGEFILIAKIDNEIVGFTSIWLDDNFLHHLYIKNHFQRRGIGTMLLNLTTKKIDSNITLKCLKKNEMAINFYLKNGWKLKSKGTSTEGKYILFEYLLPS